MKRRRKRIWTVLGAVVHEIRTERITFMAGSIAYNAFVSLLPLLLLVLAIVSTIGDQQLETSLISVVEASVTPGAADVLISELKNSSIEASLFGLGVLVWGMLRIFRSLDAAFSDIYETSGANTFGDQIVDGIIVFVSMTGVVLGAIVVESRVAVGGTSSLGWLGYRLLLVTVMALALFPMYYLFPDEPEMQPIEAIPGIVFTATALMWLESVFQIYIAYSGSLADNSVLAGILVFLTWLYLSGLVILLGAAINAVFSNRSADVNISPVISGVPASTTEDSPPVYSDSPAAVVAELEARLPTASEVTVTVDGDSIQLPVPEGVETDADGSRLPFVDDTANITLQWRRRDDED